MKKYLELMEGNSSKFWSIETVENQITVIYGRIGSNGKSDTKMFPSAEAAEKEAIKQANAKIKKGYVEKESPALPDSETTPPQSSY
ncbi:MAG: WGR domain-containing protein [Bacteroides sp.]|nr:WGR domain-containing protein [Bacteroides sp.]